jgi:PAS domain S-box-containing protein
MQRKMRRSNRPWGSPGIRAKLILSFLAAVLPAVLLLVAVDYGHHDARRGEMADECRALGQVASLAVQARIEQVAAAGRLAVAMAGPDASPAALTAALEDLLRGHPGYLDAFVLDPQGQLVASAPPAYRPIVQPVSPLGQDIALSDLFLAAPDDRLALQVLAAVPGGTAGVTLDAQALAALVSPQAAHGLAQIALCDRRGLAMGAALPPDVPWEARDWSGYPHVQQARLGQEALAPALAGQLDGLAYAGAAVPLGGTGWVVEVRQPAPDVLSYLQSRALTGLLPLGGLTLLAVALATSIGSWFTGAVHRLAVHARGLGRGQLNERIRMNTGDELEDLARALNQMARQMEERDRRLRARTAELDAIITQSAEGVAIHGPAGELQRLNPAGIRIMGRSTVRLGLSLSEQVAWFKIHTATGAPVEPNDLPVAAALRGETRVGQELRIETESGQERIVAFSAAPLSDLQSQIYGAVSILRDMTEAHQAQQEKDNFISVVSHELKTPITSIKGYAQMLLRRAEEAGSDERDLKGLRIINDEVERMVELINQLLDVSRLEMQRLQLNQDRVDLVALTLDTVDRLQMTTNRHTLRPRVPPGPVWVQGDAMRLVQVLGNLIMNAIKYSPDGGPVEVSLESQEGRAWVSVRDWGIGIAPEDQPRLFQRFWRGTRTENTSLTGMGLGLYISREIIQRHHGDIVFRSQPGQGSTFLFWLPLDEEA